jgi:multimeric flavodoxin WrbA
VLNSKALQRLVILNYKNAEGEELVGLALELVEESNGGIQVRVLRDSNIVSCVSVFTLKECRVDDLQGCDCCE